MANGTASAAEYEFVIHQVVAETGVPSDVQRVLERALSERVRANVERSQRQFDAGVLRDALIPALRDFASFGTEGLRPEELTEADVAAFFDSLCERFHLPYPLCPADD